MNTTKITILLVEDDQIDQMMFERFVKQEGLPYETKVVNSLIEARESFSSYEFDMIILDYFLTDGTAFEFLKFCKETPTIIVTGAADTELAIEAVKAGAYDYLTKDLQREYLRKLPFTIEKALQRKRYERELQRYKANLEYSVQKRTAELEAEIADRERAEGALRKSELRYRRLVENAPLGIISADSLGNIMDVNPSMSAMLGAPSVEALRQLNMLTSPSLVEAEIASDFQQCFESELSALSERFYTTKWGKQVYLRYHLSPIRNDDGVLSGVQAIFEDITEQKLTEEALQESETEYRYLFKNMPSGFAYHKILLDEENRPADYVFLEINEAFERITGLSHSIIGKRGTEIIPGLKTLKPDLIRIYGEIALTGKSAALEFFFEPFGVWHSVFAYSPEIGYFVTIVNDISERKWAEEALVKLNEDLEQLVDARTRELQKANQSLQEYLVTLQETQQKLVESEKMAALGGLVAGVAHEINTPVGVSVTAASYLKEQTTEFEHLYTHDQMTRSTLHAYLKTAHKASEIILGNLKRAAEQIRGFKQVAVDQTSDEKRRFQLKPYLDGILLSLHPKLKRTRHTIIVQCPDDYEVDSYPGAFSQIVTNLVMNSLIHGFEKKTHGEIRLEVSKMQQALFLHYSDNGRGMTPEERDRIFEPFFTTKRSHGGTGLGLHIVYNLVTQRLHGSIECVSAPDRGASFHIHIPLEEETSGKKGPR